MLSGIIICTIRGDPLFSRFCRSDVNENVAELFRIAVVLPSAYDDDTPPIVSVRNVSFLHIRVEDMIFAAVTNRNADGILGFEFLYHLSRLLRAYFGGKLSASKVNANIPLLHELLEEILDHGYPQNTDPELLNVFITQGKINSVKLMNKKQKDDQLTVVATGATPWRPPNVKYEYKKNELWIDVIEKINLLVSHQGAILKQDVEGEIHLKSQLSGTPQCEFAVNDKLVLEKEIERGKKVNVDGAIGLDDLTFHQCVRLQRFEEDKIISFVPPDGEFVLMRYRTTERITLPFRLLSHVKQESPTQLSYEVNVISEFPPKLYGLKVQVIVPTPDYTAVCRISPKDKSDKAKYDPQKGGIVWRIKRFPGQNEHRLNAIVDLMPNAADKPWDRPPISIDFTVPMFAASGMRIRFLRVAEKSGYNAAKWVRYLTKAGSYQRRI